MRHGLLASLALLTAAACGGPEIASPPGNPPLPQVGTRQDPIARALAVWEHGADAIEEPVAGPWSLSPGEDGWNVNGDRMPTDLAALEPPFRDFDARVRCFLEFPYVAEAVHFGCADTVRYDEPWVTAGLDHADPLVRLRALVVLMRVRAPRSVDRQWEALQGLCQGSHAVQFEPVTRRLRAEFAPEALDPVLARAVPKGRYFAPYTTQWSIRAAGATGYRRALDRVAELSCSANLDISLAAERSLVDFQGPDADAALARCVQGWQYDAALRAANALLSRDPERLRSTLLAMSPTDCVYWQGIFLARLEDSRAVPILCREVSKVAIIDREMFDWIARLAGPEHLDAVLGLSESVRPEQVGLAREVVRRVRARLGR